MDEGDFDIELFEVPLMNDLTQVLAVKMIRPPRFLYMTGREKRLKFKAP